jgi:hypothetical protein
MAPPASSALLLTNQDLERVLTFNSLTPDSTIEGETRQEHVSVPTFELRGAVPTGTNTEPEAHFPALEHPIPLGRVSVLFTHHILLSRYVYVSMRLRVRS